MADLVKELAGKQTVLLVIPSKKYDTILKQTAKKLAAKGSVAYVTLNKTFEALSTEFKKAKVNTENIVFIDAISKTLLSKPPQTDHAYYLNSPGALTEMSLVISKFVKHEFDYIIFDSITNLMTYQKAPVVHKFISSLSRKSEGKKTKFVFLALDLPDHKSLVQQCSMYVDKTVNA
jgi:hypothetical protein